MKTRMVKRGGGTKRKIPMEKISKKESLSTSFTKRTYGLYSKASQLCLLSGAQIAVLSTPPSSHSNVSFYSFGHTSVDAVVSAFLSGQRLAPVREEKRSKEDVGIALARKDLGLGFWWNDELLAKSENPDEIKKAMESMSILLKELRSGDNKNQNLILQSSNSEIGCVISDDDEFVVSSDDSNVNNNITEEQDEINAVCESFCVTDNNNNNNDDVLTGSLVGYDQEMDIDQLIDFQTPFDTSILDEFLLENAQEEIKGSLLMNSDDVSTNPNLIYDFEGFEDEELVHSEQRYSDFFSELTNIAAV